MTRDFRVFLLGLLHVAWMVGSAALIVWVDSGVGFTNALLSMLVAHSAWRAAQC